MNAYTIAEQLYAMAKNGEDGTIRVDGGTLPSAGYYVGGKCPSFIAKDVAELDRGELAWWVGNNPAKYYGVWVDSSSKERTIYIDAVTHVNDERLAVLLGKSRNEIAIWDIANTAEIVLRES